MEDIKNLVGEEKLIVVEGIDEVECLNDAVVRAVLEIEDDLIKQRAIMMLEDKARKIGRIRNFQKIVGIVKQRMMSEALGGQDYVAQMEGIDLVLNTGEWICDSHGIRRFTEKNGSMIEEVACWQPVIISEIFFNRELCSYRVQLAFKESQFSKVKTITVPKSMIATASSITNLADYGIAVTNITAPLLVRYLNDLERLNVDKIPHNSAISRLGWIDDTFVPYDKSISFDGETMYKELFDSVDVHGDYEEWKRMANNENSIEAKMILGASFASPLVGLLDKLVFFTHLWGTSGIGKSVALYFAQSVWGNPRKLVQNLNGTAVALERLASFYCNIPLCLDELQTLKKTVVSKDGGFDDILYKLGQGRGKSRGRKDGAIDKVSTWALSIITTGEEPITSDNSGGGARNRVIDIYCRKNIFESATRVVSCCCENYGYAGKEFVEKLTEYVARHGKTHLNDIYATYFDYLMKSTPTDKQAMSATMIALGYTLMNMFIFGMEEEDALRDGLKLLDEIRPYLIDITQVDNVENFYTDILSFVAQNKHHFVFSKKSGLNKFEYNPLENRIEVWGKITDCEINISNMIIKKFCVDNNRNYTKMLRALSEADKTIRLPTNDNRFEGTRPIRINGSLIRCISLKIPSEEEQAELTPIEDDGLPF